MKKSLVIAAMACMGLFLAACRVYTPVEQTADVLFEDGSIGDYLSGYEIYYHNGNNIYNLHDVHTSGDTIFGFAVKADTSRNTSAKKSDMNIFGNSDKEISDSSLVAIPKTEISNVQMMGLDGRATFLKSMSTTAGLVLLIVVIILAIGLIGISVWASAASSDQSNNSSNTSSDQSSDSSSSDSGSGNSSGGSGCYVATMVYGSYDADEVLVLRRFRDNVLQHSAGGRRFIQWYYGWSPGFVKKYSKYRLVHRTVKSILQPLIWLLK